MSLLLVKQNLLLHSYNVNVVQQAGRSVGVNNTFSSNRLYHARVVSNRYMSFRRRRHKRLVVTHTLVRVAQSDRNTPTQSVACARIPDCTIITATTILLQLQTPFNGQFPGQLRQGALVAVW